VRSRSGRRVVGRMLVAGALVAIAVGCAAGSALALPAGWAYELVSPGDALQASVQTGVGAPVGSRAWFQVLTPIVEGQPSGNITTGGAARIPNVGWQTRTLADPSAHGTLSYAFDAASEDASQVILHSCDVALIGCRGDVVFTKVGQDGLRTLMLSVPRSSFFAPMPTFAGSSADASSIFVMNADAGLGVPALLAVDTHSQGQGLYASHDGQVSFLGFDQNGAVLPCGEILANDTQTPFVGSGFEQGGLSADGSTVVFESPDPNAIANDPTDCPGPVDVYVRHSGQTLNISAPTNANPDQGATYVGNSRDGNTVYFVTASQLVPGDTDTDPDIYAADMTTPIPTITRITPDANIALDGDHPRVAVSPGGDFVYFEASNQINGQGTAGQANLFVYHAGTITFIATASADHFALGNALTGGSGSPITPDGRHLIFRSIDPLTGQPTGGRAMIFQYTFGAGLKCVSCRPDGNPPITSNDDKIGNPNVSGQVDQRVQSDDGKAVFFATDEPLVPEDLSPARDVYMWQDDGTPNGKLSLISSGQGKFDSFVGASADGKTVFFTTYDRLLPSVENDNLKLYAARLGGGFPAPPAAAVGCGGDACQGQSPTPPGLLAPGSMNFIGPGNKIDLTPKLTIARITSATKRALARSGHLTLAIRTNTPTTIHAALTARIGRHNIAAGSASKRLANAGTTHLTLHLSTHARAYLKTHHTLHVQITITSTGAAKHTITLTLHTS
jgi:hypothetical protein